MISTGHSMSPTVCVAWVPTLCCLSDKAMLAHLEIRTAVLLPATPRHVSAHVPVWTLEAVPLSWCLNLGIYLRVFARPCRHKLGSTNGVMRPAKMTAKRSRPDQWPTCCVFRDLYVMYVRSSSQSRTAPKPKTAMWLAVN